MEFGYKFINTKENIDKLLSNNYKMSPEGNLYKKKKVKYDNELVRFAIQIYNDNSWATTMTKILGMDIFNENGLFYEPIMG